MKKTWLIASFVLCIFLLFSCSDSEIQSDIECTEHVGIGRCFRCGLNYFDELCEDMTHAKYNSAEGYYYTTIDDSYVSGFAVEIAYFPKSKRIVFGMSEVMGTTEIATLLSMTDANGKYDYKVVRSSGGELSGTIDAASLVENGIVPYDICSFGAQKNAILHYANDRIVSLVHILDILYSGSPITSKNFGFTSVE